MTGSLGHGHLLVRSVVEGDDSGFEVAATALGSGRACGVLLAFCRELVLANLSGPDPLEAIAGYVRQLRVEIPAVDDPPPPWQLEGILRSSVGAAGSIPELDVGGTVEGLGYLIPRMVRDFALDDSRIEEMTAAAERFLERAVRAAESSRDCAP